jgi:hypothetical protein
MAKKPSRLVVWIVIGIAAVVGLMCLLPPLPASKRHPQRIQSENRAPAGITYSLTNSTQHSQR